MVGLVGDFDVVWYQKSKDDKFQGNVNLHIQFNSKLSKFSLTYNILIGIQQNSVFWGEILGPLVDYIYNIKFGFQFEWLSKFKFLLIN